MKKQKEIYSTDSFQLASYLLCESCRLIDLDKRNPRRVVFNFEDNGEIGGLVNKFLSYEARVEPHRYFSSQKDLKQLLYQN